MYCCVTYDIRSNRLRLRISKHLRRIGLLRYQKSVFLGRMDEETRLEIERELRPLLAPDDKLAVVPLEKAAFQSMLHQTRDTHVHRLGKRFDYVDL